jgi:hypothetical protein
MKTIEVGENFHPADTFMLGQTYRPMQPLIPGGGTRQTQFPLTPGEFAARQHSYQAVGPNVPALQKHKFRFLFHTQFGSGVNTPDLSVSPSQLMNVYDVDSYVRAQLAQRGCPFGITLTPSGQPYPPVPTFIPNGCVVNGKQVTVFTEMLVGNVWKCVQWFNGNWNDCLEFLPQDSRNALSGTDTGESDDGTLGQQTYRPTGPILPTDQRQYEFPLTPGEFAARQQAQRAVQPKLPPIIYFGTLVNGAQMATETVQQFWSCQQIADRARNLYFSSKPSATNYVQIVVARLDCGPNCFFQTLGTLGPNEAQNQNALWLKCPPGT